MLRRGLGFAKALGIGQQRFISSKRSVEAVSEDLLVRDFVFRSLYGPQGYFEQRTVVGSCERAALDACGDAYFPQQGLNYKDLMGENDYRWKVKELYDLGGEAWLTPSELFSPWYARAVARYLQAVAAAERKTRLVVAELGPGNGTFARGFLDYLHECAPALYDQTRYIMVEKSSRLARIQREGVARAHGCVEVVHADAVDWGGFPVAGARTATAVIGLEVLDNLPHDRVVAHRDGSISEAFVRVESSGGKEPRLLHGLRSLSDPLIVRALGLSGALPLPNGLTARLADGREILPVSEDERGSRAGKSQGILGQLRRARDALGKLAGKEESVWLPTRAVTLLENLHLKLPADAHLILADFDSLPDALPGLNAPVVQSKPEGKSQFHCDYLRPMGTADIFHPTDFYFLRDAWQRISGRKSYVVSHADFCLRYAECDQTRCLNGYNPLIEDYRNMTMLVSRWTEGTRESMP